MRAPPRGDPAAVATLRRAADAARRLGALTTAARLLERALAEPPLQDVADATLGAAAMRDASTKTTAGRCSRASRTRRLTHPCAPLRRATWP